jgi:PKD repeat protein
MKCKLSATKRAASAIAVTLAVLVLMLGLACAKAKAPQAQFKGDPVTGLVPLTVNFTDQSTGEITSWKWNFGDTKTDTTRNPSHTYTTAGQYNVILKVTGPGGEDTKTKPYYVVVLKISEAANAEVNEADSAIRQCMADAGAVELLAAVTGWDGSAGMVKASGSGGTKDAASYLAGGTFKAKYDVAKDGTIILGTDVSWGGSIKWSGEKPVWWLDTSA